MLNHSSAKQYEETPHVIQEAGAGSRSRKQARGAGAGSRKTTISNALKRRNGISGPRQDAGAGSRRRKTTISNALKRRAQAVIKDKSIDAESRAIIRYALETNDPWLPELVRRAEAGETIIYTVNSLKHPHPTGGVVSIGTR